MQDTDKQRVNEILEEVLELEPEARKKFLKRSGEAPEVLKEVEMLLSFEGAAEASMNLAAIEFSHDFLEDDSTNIGEQIDVYTVTRELGTGGMGAVYLAERTDGNLNQQVALKLLRKELNTAVLRERFRTEREILAALEHPGIARLLNAGTTPDGIPFLAMEYVDGLPINQYCEKNRLDLKGRLEVFLKICEAVGFAHRNLVVHRDLKPSNILVDADGNPKLLDFGISKILSDQLGEADESTITRMGVMTPSYASPEQLQKKSVTTAADIYSLGVILYEMLTGSRPFKSKEDDIKAIYDAVEGEAPPLPSEAARTGTGPQGAKGTEDLQSAEHGTSKIASDTGPSRGERTEPDPTPVRWQLLRGDLDNIILKALKKEPERRYSTAERFGDDIRRFLDGLPVSARADTLAYRAGKFVKRNSLAVGAGFLVLLALCAGLGATLWQARQTAIEAERARAEAVKTKKALDFLGNILNFANPFWNSPNPERKQQATIAEAMELAVKNVEEELGDEPEVQAEIFYILGKAYFGKGDYAASERLLKRSIERYDSVRGNENLRSMQIRGNLGDHQYLQGKYEEAEKNYLRCVEYLRPRLDENEETKLYLAGALTGLGNVYAFNGRFEESADLNKEALEIAEEFSGEERRMVPILLGNLGFAHTSMGELGDAARYFEQALEEVRAQGADGSADEAMILGELGRVALSRGEHSRAEQLARSSYEMYSKALGERNFFSFGAANLIGKVLLEKGELEEAQGLLSETLGMEREAYPKGHILVAVTTSLLGEVDTRKGRLKEGEAKHREVLEYVSGMFKEPNQQIATAKARLGNNLVAQKRLSEGEDLLKSAYETLRRTRGERHPETVAVREQLDRSR